MKIAVIGAGFTGSLVADFLQSTGHDVIVFEKSRGRGGRMTQKRCDWGVFDMGAAEIRASEPRFNQFMEQLSLQQLAAHWDTDSYIYDGKLHITPESVSRYVFTPGMSAICRHFLKNVTLERSVRIEHLQRLPSGWLLWDDQERKYSGFDWVVVTAPWPQAQPILQEHIEVPAFNAADWLSCWTVAIQTRQKLATRADVIYASHGPVQLAVNDGAKPRRDIDDSVWVIQLSHEESARLYQEGATQAIDSAVGQLMTMTGESVEVAQHYQHFWRYARMSPEAVSPGIIFSPDEALAAVGDWSVGGSIQSAFRAVQQFKQFWT